MTVLMPPDRSAVRNGDAAGKLKGKAEPTGGLQSIACSLNSEEGNQPCLWMQTGIVPRKFCRLGYRCRDCRFESALRRAAAKNIKLRGQRGESRGTRGRIIGWEEKMRALPLVQRPCVHSMKQEISLKNCTNEYRCSNCDFDQYFHDEYKVHAVVLPVDFLEVDGFNIPQGYYLHRGHAWAKIEEGPSVRIGIDDLALRLLGPFDCIDAPLMGKAVRAGEPHVAISRGAKQARMLCPVSGVVTAVNSKQRNPGTAACQNPYSDGWVMSIHPENLRKDLRNLMIAQETREFLIHEVNQLHQIIEEIGGPSATDGGHLGCDLYGKMPLLGWERLTKTFLRT